MILMGQKITISSLLNSETSGKTSMKPLRKRIGNNQIIELQTLFNKGIRFPEKDLREKLSEKLGLTPRTIQVWFQNRRQNIKCHEIQNDLQMATILQSLKKALK